MSRSRRAEDTAQVLRSWRIPSTSRECSSSNIMASRSASSWIAAMRSLRREIWLVNSTARVGTTGQSHIKNCNCPGSPFAGVNSTCTGRKTMDFQHLNGALAYHYRAKRAYFGQYRDGFSNSLAIDLSSKGLPGQLRIFVNYALS